MLNDAVTIDEAAVSAAAAALKGGDLLSVIEYQRAVHAEARAIDDATIRGVSTVDGILYVTTFPCHLCYKHALSARIKRVEYIDPYPKSRAVQMYPVDVEERLIPFTGVAPRRYLEIFDDRPAPQSDESGRFPTHDPSVAQPLVGPVSEDDSRADKERRAIHRLKEQYRT
ncbi:deaminase (plasmid) [Mycolicibacterium fortuitum]|nr:deaminase [Mycolicibacterium fortuitum]